MEEKKTEVTVNPQEKEKKKEKKNKKKINSFFSGLRTEWGRIVWTPKDALIRQSGAVLVGSAVLVLFISIVDSGALAILEHIF